MRLKWILVLGSVLLSLFFWMRFDRHSRVFYGDALGYYYYLPSAFIHGNLLHIEQLPEDSTIPFGVKQYAQEFTLNPASPTGHYVNQYTVGVALLYSPFFFAAHAYALLHDAAANGFTAPYEIGVRIGNWVFTLLGLLLTLRLLRRYFSEKAAIGTVFLLLIGTHLFWFSNRQAGMVHPVIFFLVAALMVISETLYRKPTTGKFALLGLTGGLITLCRPTDILFLMLPLFYAVPSRSKLKERFMFLKLQTVGLSFALVFFSLPLLLQAILWKHQTGQWLYYSYGSQGFDFLRPRLFAGLFGAKNGWLFYSPLFWLVIPGLFVLNKRNPWRQPLLLLFPIYVWVIYSWHCYNYINGLGSRPMIHLYPLLAFPLAALTDHALQRGKGWRFGLLTFFGLTTLLSLAFHIQTARRIIWPENSNLSYTLQNLFRSKLGYAQLCAMDTQDWQPDLSTMPPGRELGAWPARGMMQDTLIPPSLETPEISIKVPLSSALRPGERWLEARGSFFQNSPPSDLYHMPLMVMEVRRAGKTTLSWTKLSISNTLGQIPPRDSAGLTLTQFQVGEWGDAYFFIPVPAETETSDTLKLSLWNLSTQPFHMRSLSLRAH